MGVFGDPNGCIRVSRPVYVEVGPNQLTWYAPSTAEVGCDTSRGLRATTKVETMQRRKFVVGLGSLTAGGAAAMGTGAFTRAGLNDRNADIRVTTDQSAFLALRPTGSNDSNKYVSFGTDQLSVDIDSDAAGAGSGVNENSNYYFKNLFKIVNQGSQPVTVTIEGADSSDAGKRLKWVNQNGGGDGATKGSVSGTTIAPGEEIVVSLDLMVRGQEAGTQISDSFRITATA